MADNEKQILDAFKNAGAPLKAGQVADVTGLDEKVVGKLIKKLKDEGKLVSPKRCFYSLPYDLVLRLWRVTPF